MTTFFKRWCGEADPVHTGMVETAVASQPVEGRRTHTADLVASILLLIAHIGVAVVIAFIAPFLVMGTDQCAYETCGDPKWVEWAVYLAWGGGALLVFADAGLTGLLLAKHRIAFYVPIVFCLLQLGLGQLVLYMASFSGPVAPH